MDFMQHLHAIKLTGVKEMHEKLIIKDAGIEPDYNAWNAGIQDAAEVPLDSANDSAPD